MVGTAGLNERKEPLPNHLQAVFACRSDEFLSREGHQFVPVVSAGVDARGNHLADSVLLQVQETCEHRNSDLAVCPHCSQRCRPPPSTAVAEDACHRSGVRVVLVPAGPFVLLGPASFPFAFSTAPFRWAGARAGSSLAKGGTTWRLWQLVV